MNINKEVQAISDSGTTWPAKIQGQVVPAHPKFKPHPNLKKIQSCWDNSAPYSQQADDVLGSELALLQ